MRPLTLAAILIISALVLYEAIGIIRAYEMATYNVTR